MPALRADGTLTGLSDRVGALGGTLTITSPPAQGTVLRAAVPVPGRRPR
jgi:signal transduction histidine kinase